MHLVILRFQINVNPCGVFQKVASYWINLDWKLVFEQKVCCFLKSFMHFFIDSIRSLHFPELLERLAYFSKANAKYKVSYFATSPSFLNPVAFSINLRNKWKPILNIQ